MPSPNNSGLHGTPYPYKAQREKSGSVRTVRWSRIWGWRRERRLSPTRGPHPNYLRSCCSIANSTSLPMPEWYLARYLMNTRRPRRWIRSSVQDLLQDARGTHALKMIHKSQEPLSSTIRIRMDCWLSMISLSFIRRQLRPNDLQFGRIFTPSTTGTIFWEVIEYLYPWYRVAKSCVAWSPSPLNGCSNYSVYWIHRTCSFRSRHGIFWSGYPHLHPTSRRSLRSRVYHQLKIGILYSQCIPISVSSTHST